MASKTGEHRNSKRTFDDEDTQKIKEWALARVAARGSGPSTPDGTGSIGLAIPVDTNVSDEEAYDADRNLAIEEEFERRMTETEMALERAEMNFFLRCKTCNRPGIYFTRNPSHGGPIMPNEWYAKYKPDPEQIFHNPIVCQLCLAKGKEHASLHLAFKGKGFDPDVRHTFKAPKDPEMAKAVGACRCGPVPSTCGNDHILEWNKKLAKWRAEHPVKQLAEVTSG